jgi:hypothetical protein
VFERHDVLIFSAVRIFQPYRIRLSEKAQLQSRKKLTSEIEVDNLEKFAKTSYAAEVLLDRLKQSR